MSTTNEHNYLSGDIDPTLYSKRQEKWFLQSSVSTINGCKNKIQVIEDEQPASSSQLSKTTFKGEFDEDATNDSKDDTLPPPIDAFNSESTESDFANIPQTADVVKERYISSNNDQEQLPSLMEQMMNEALKAKSDELKQRNQVHRKNATKKDSFSTMKKGFLNTNRKKKQLKNRIGNLNEKVSNDNSNVQINNDLQIDETVYELDEYGNLKEEIKTQNTIETIRPNNLDEKHDPLRIQEVQDAMKDMNILHSSSSNWATNPDLTNKILSNPKLMQGMNNPKFTAALEALQQNPKEAMKKFQNHADILEFIREFCGVIGEHFTELGDRNDNKSPGKKGANNSTTSNNIGPMAEEALKREEERRSDGYETSWEEKMTEEEKKKLDSIMADQELTSLLMDTDMQRVMHECSFPGRMKMYIDDPTYGPKLRKLINAGLLQVA